MNLRSAADGGPQTLPKQPLCWKRREESWLMACPPSISPFHIFLTRAARSDHPPQQHSPAPPLGTFRPDDMLEPSSSFPVHTGVSPQLGVLARSPNERPPRPAPFYMKTQQLSQELPLDVWAPHLIIKTAELGKPMEQTHYGLMFPQTSPPVPEFTKSGISLSRIPVLLIILYVHRIKIFI